MKKWEDEETDIYSAQPKELGRLAKEAAESFVAEESAKTQTVGEKTETQQ